MWALLVTRSSGGTDRLCEKAEDEVARCRVRCCDDGDPAGTRVELDVCHLTDRRAGEREIHWLSSQFRSARALVMRSRAGCPYTAERWSRANALAYRASSRGWVTVSSAEYVSTITIRLSNMMKALAGQI